jgi:hypothetical protein
MVSLVNGRIKSEETSMRNLFFVLLLLVVCVVGFGFYRGWFTFEKTHDPATGRDGVQIEIDRNKIKPDIDRAKKTLGVDNKTGGTEEPKDR